MKRFFIEILKNVALNPKNDMQVDLYLEWLSINRESEIIKLKLLLNQENVLLKLSFC